MKRAYLRFSAWATQDAGLTPCPAAVRCAVLLAVNVALMGVALASVACVAMGVCRLFGIE